MSICLTLIALTFWKLKGEWAEGRGEKFNLRYIQELLGHESGKTTEIYTHDSNKDLGKIKSPLDDLLIK